MSDPGPFTLHAIGAVSSPRVEATDDDWGPVRQPRWSRELMAGYW